MGMGVCFRDETDMRMSAEQPPEGAGLSSKRGDRKSVV